MTLTNEELVEMIVEGRDVEENLEVLYLQNQNMLRKVAESFIWSGEDVEDLCQVGWIGLQKAVHKYDPAGGAKFLTYAVFWVRQEIGRYIDNCGSLIRLPVNRQAQVFQYQKFVAEYRLQYGHDPDRQTICNALEVSDHVLESIEKAREIQNVKSLSEPVRGAEDGEDQELGDLIPSAGCLADECDDRFLAESIKSQIWAILDALREDQRVAIIENVMNERTLADVGQDLGVGAERVRQLRDLAIRNIKKCRSFRKLSADCFDLYGLGLRGTGLNAWKNTGFSSTESAALRLLDAEQSRERMLKFLVDVSALKTWIIWEQLNRADRLTATGVIRELVSDPGLQEILIRVMVDHKSIGELNTSDYMKYRGAVSNLHKSIDKLRSEMPIGALEEPEA